MNGDRLRVVVAEALPQSGLEPLRNGRFDIVAPKGAAELDAALRDCDALLVRSATQVTRELLERAPRLRVVGRAGVGTDNIDLDAATERGIAVFNAPTGNTISAAELAFALLLAAVRRVAAADRSVRDGRWDRKSFGGIELNGKTLGLVGAGRIGTAVARRARAFGMQILAYDPYLTEERARSLEMESVDLDTLLARADVVTLHVPLTDATRNLLDERHIASMKPGAVLVNAARGGVVDEAALARALTDGRLGAAALDVFESEPPPADHPLRDAPNVVMTPHLGASTVEAQHNVALEVAESIRDALLDDDFSRALNAPSVGGEALRALRPMLDLARRLGRLAHGLSGGPITALDVEYTGDVDDALPVLSASVLTGLLADVVGSGAINLVNAQHLARQRGMQVRTTRTSAASESPERVKLRAHWKDGSAVVGGAMLGHAHPRIIRIDNFHVDIRPAGTLIVMRNRDVPGVIGRVGTLLGEAGVNIGEYHQTRREEGGEALATVAVDGAPPREVAEELAGLADVLSVRVVRLD